MSENETEKETKTVETGIAETLAAADAMGATTPSEIAPEAAEISYETLAKQVAFNASQIATVADRLDRLCKVFGVSV